MPAPALVPYADSDEDEDGDGAIQAQVTQEARVHTSLGIRQSEPRKGDWICSVHVPLNDFDRLIRTLHRATRSLQADGIVPLDRSALHVSLTRPIVLRRAECDRLVEVVRQAVKTTTRSPSTSPLSFARFAVLPSEEGERLYYVAEVGQGWDHLRRLTACLDQALQNHLPGTRTYHSDARYHISFAHTPSTNAAAAQKDVEALNEALGDRLRSSGTLAFDSIEISMGTKSESIPLT